MSKRCETCSCWLFSFERESKKFGVCDNTIVDGRILVDREHDVYEQETVIHTEQNFGCIYHTPLHGNVVTKIDLE
jgi:hypothetical protein